MILTAVVVFLGGTIWTVVYSFTDSKLLPRLRFVGLEQYERLWSQQPLAGLDREPGDLRHPQSLIFSLVIGFLLAALLDQKIRFEDTFRTIFLYPFALSFIVTGLVWQWLLNPDFGVQSVVRGARLRELHLRPALQRRHRHLRRPDRRALAGHRAHHVPDARGPARHRRGHLEGHARRRHPDVEDLPLRRHPDDAPGLHHHARHHHLAASSSSTTSSSRRPAAAPASPRRCRRNTSTTSCSARRTSARASPPRR